MLWFRRVIYIYISFQSPFCLYVYVLTPNVQIISLNEYIVTAKYNDDITVIKISKIWHARDLWKLAQSYKQLRLSSKSIRYSLTLWLSKLPMNFEMRFVKQYSVNVVILDKGPVNICYDRKSEK